MTRRDLFIAFFGWTTGILGALFWPPLSRDQRCEEVEVDLREPKEMFATDYSLEGSGWHHTPGGGRVYHITYGENILTGKRFTLGE